MELWQVGCGLVAVACYALAAAPAVRRLVEQLAERAAQRDAEIEHRRATCPNRPGPKTKVIVQDGWCDWCRITHDQVLNPSRGNAALFAVFRCGNVLPSVYGGVCPSCGVPHVEEPPRPQVAAPEPGLDTGILRRTPLRQGLAQVVPFGPRPRRTW